MANKNTRSTKDKKSQAAETPQDRKEARREAAAKYQNRPKKKRNWGEYFRGVRTEMKKVVWPTKRELGEYTVIVVATCAFFALMFWGIDSGVLAALKSVLGINL